MKYISEHAPFYSSLCGLPVSILADGVPLSLTASEISQKGEKSRAQGHLGATEVPQ